MSLQAMFGAKSNKFIRHTDDFYATDPAALDLFLNRIRAEGYGNLVQSPIWECAGGEGHLSNRLKELGYSVYSSDIVDRNGACDDVIDFLKTDKKWSGTILTNPPFKYSTEFVNSALDKLTDGTAIFFLKIQFIESKARYINLFSKNKPHSIWAHVTRQKTAKCADFSDANNAFMYAWFVWKKNYHETTKLYWLM